MRQLSKTPSNSRYVNKEVALNEILEGNPTLSTATISSVNDIDSSTLFLSANADRKAVIITNDSTAVLYVALGSDASLTNYTYRLVQYGTLELKGDLNYVGEIYGIWASNASGAARITELEV